MGNDLSFYCFILDYVARNKRRSGFEYTSAAGVNFILGVVTTNISMSRQRRHVHTLKHSMRFSPSL